MKNQKLFYYSILTLVFILGIILRLKTYFIGRPLWHDECSLAMSIYSRNIFGYFKMLEHLQSAPPIFMGLTKLITLIAGIKEPVLRFIPQISALLSIGLFYQLTKQVFTKKLTIILANILFCINYQLIYYAQEFKQYSTDVFMVLLLILYLSKLEIKDLSYKKIILNGIFFSMCPLISLPTIFVITGYLINQIIKYKKEVLSKLITILLPMITMMFIYYIKVLHPSQAAQLNLYKEWWDAGFIKLSFTSLIQLFKVNYAFFFRPNNMILLAIFLTFTGLYNLIRQYHNKTNILLLTILTCALLGSALEIYPIYERVALYLIPIVIIIITISFDKFSKNNLIFTTFFSIIFLVYFSGYNYNYIGQFFKKDVFIRKDARSTMAIIKEKYKKDDYILFNKASDSEYFYYSRYFDFYTEKTGIINLPEYNGDLYKNILNSLPTDRNYWFYYAYDWTKEPVIPFLKEWSKNKNVLYLQDINGSYIMYIKNR